MCEGAVNKGILKKNSSWMQVPRDPNINGTYTFTYMLKSSFIHCNALFGFSGFTENLMHCSLGKLTWKLSFATHPVYSAFIYHL